VFIPYEIYDPDGDTLKFTVYEFASRNLFESFLYNLLAGTDNDSRPSQLSGADVVQNTGRFGIFNVFEKLKTYSDRTLRVSSVVYPYWENAAILTENRLTVMLAALALFAFVPAIFVAVLFGWLLMKSKGKGKVIVELYGDAVDIWRRRVWRLKVLRAANAAKAELPEAAETPELPEFAEDSPEDDTE
jgi:hypothetical protein